jgi:hypothetical protein
LVKVPVVIAALALSTALVILATRKAGANPPQRQLCPASELLPSAGKTI